MVGGDNGGQSAVGRAMAVGGVVGELPGSDGDGENGVLPCSDGGGDSVGGPSGSDGR